MIRLKLDDTHSRWTCLTNVTLDQIQFYAEFCPMALQYWLMKIPPVKQFQLRDTYLPVLCMKMQKWQGFPLSPPICCFVEQSIMISTRFLSFWKAAMQASGLAAPGISRSFQATA